VRTVDASQYEERMKTFNFDMVVNVWGESLSPGNEQRDFWGSAAADVPGSQNIVGIKNPVVDAMVQKVIYADDRDALVTATHALDRVLLWNHYVIPNWHLTYWRVAYWDKLDRPKVTPPYALALDAWWVDPDKAKSLESKEKALGQ
jgi:microcin C transport system substrate-binding protein